MRRIDQARTGAYACLRPKVFFKCDKYLNALIESCRYANRSESINGYRSIALVNLFVFGLALVLIAGPGISPRRIGMAAPSQRQTIEQRLQELEDREEIRQLLMDYGRFLDQRDFAAFSQLFAEKEGEWNGGLGRAVGQKAIQKLMKDTIGKDSGDIALPNLHLFTNEAIQVYGDRATAVTKWIFVMGSDANQPRLIYIGHYNDSLVREKERWKFQRRVVYSDIPAARTLEPQKK